jgi:predicted ATP-binding protein involved in virulence
MDINEDIFLEKIKSIAEKDKGSVTEIVDHLITLLYQSPEILSTNAAEKILQWLRNNRMSDLITKMVEVFTQIGLQSFKIRRLYAQSLIDTSNYTSAISILNALITETKDTNVSEYYEAQGKLGTAYKRLYVNAVNATGSPNINFIRSSISAYLSAYIFKPEEYQWHGINAVALLYRAEKDKITLTDFPDYKIIAANILKAIEIKNDEARAEIWDFVTATEACIALNETKEAIEWISGYVRSDLAGSLELSSTLTQFEDVWLIDENTEFGKLLLSLIRGKLLESEGGNLLIDTKNLRNQASTENLSPELYDRLLKATERSQPDNNKIKHIEKNFGSDSFQTYKQYLTGAKRCMPVARIGDDPSAGIATGFLLQGDVLHESLGDEPVLITCTHVIGDDPGKKALSIEKAVIIFEALDNKLVFKVDEIIWSSPTNELDATIIRFCDEDKIKLKELTRDVEMYVVTKRLPIPDQSQGIYIIGHPFGGPMRISFQDNQLLDHDGVKIHYQTPTDAGSSGSPVFNRQWDLIGIHHASNSEMPRLNDQPGIYDVNEGISILAIINKFREEHDANTISYFIRKGSYYESAKKYDEALKNYADAYEKFPEAYEFLKKIADVYTSKGDVNQYLESLERYNIVQNRITLERNLRKKLIINNFSTSKHAFYGNLLWPLNPQMNILLGKNGYGKSHLMSVMLALLQNNIQKTREFSKVGSSLTASITEEELWKEDKSGESMKEALVYRSVTSGLANPNENIISFSETGIDSVLGKIPVLAIPDARFIDKSEDFVSRSKETIDVLEDSAYHFLHQKPYAGMIENALFRICQIYAEQKDTNKISLTVLKIIETVFYKLTGDYFTIAKIESMPNTEYEVLVNTEAATKLPIQKVSQGTFSVISVFLIIFNYLKTRYTDIKDEEIQFQNAIVFIDEIDAHLHPSWQQKIICILRETFPSVQFFITGHSPLIVAGCKSGEVAVLRKVNPGDFKLNFFEHDFIGYQPGELYKLIFDVEAYDETYLKYNSLLPFKNNYEDQIRRLEKKESRTGEEIKKLDQLYDDIYFMNVVQQRNDEKL